MILNVTDKLHEGLVQLNNRRHYLPLEKPMVTETLQEAKEIISQLHNDNINDMTKNGFHKLPPHQGYLSSTPSLKSTNQNRSEDQLSQIVMDQPKEYHHLWIIYYNLLPCDKTSTSKTQLIS